jgi:benzoyl-CoA reductase/2-hydroxyglutaryl-CoA dehydratase subunit BcrC/BadD/HgdB
MATVAPKKTSSIQAQLTYIRELIDHEQTAFIAEKDDQIARIGYFCAYTPPEVLSAAGVRHARLFKAGDPTIVAQGERYTQSVFCDFSKSCIGGFTPTGGDPLYRAVDKVYNFHTCASMKRATEVIDQFVPTKLLNLPRAHYDADSRAYFGTEIAHYRDDLAALTGRSISDADVHDQIVLYNKARRLIRKISELRKRANPPLTGADFLELTRGYYYLPPEILIPAYETLYRKLSRVRDTGARPLRLMVSGSIMADGDRRLVDLIEGEIGARVVVEDHCTGLRPFTHTISEKGDPIQALANGYLDQAPCARMKPLDYAVQFSGSLARDYAVDGIVYVYLKFCSCYGVTKREFTVNYQSLGFPLVEISSDFSHSDLGQLKTRIEAFVEVLNDSKDQTPHPAGPAKVSHLGQE